MSDDARVREFFAMANARDEEGLAALLAEDAGFAFPKAPPLEGRERILKFFKLLWRRFPVLEFEVLDVIRQGEKAAIHWRNRGESKTGEAYENEGVTWLRFEGGRIGYLSDFFKDTEKF